MNKRDANIPGLERRFVDFEVRANQVDGKPVIEGSGAVFNMESSDLGGFVEVIEPGFFDDVLDNDVRGLWNHNDDIPLGRASNGTLEISQSDKSLNYVIHINADDSEAMAKYAKVTRGDVKQSSFAFTVKRESKGDKFDGDEWKSADGRTVRILKKGGCRELFDVSPVTYPAYPQTNVSADVRSRFEQFQKSLTGGPEGEEESVVMQVRQEQNRRRLELAEKEI